MNNLDASNIQQKQAVLFADVSGSTQLYEKLGDARAFAAITTCIDILRRLTLAHAGQVVKTIGDEIMVIFPNAISAAQAACEMQMVVNAKPPIDGTRIAIHIGFHFGVVLKKPDDGDVFGDTVNLAARMTKIAQAQQIITTGITVAMLPPIMRASTRSYDGLSIKGKVDEIKVCEVLWQENEELTMVTRNTFPPKTTAPTLQLVHQGDKFIVDAAHPTITIGRDEQANIIIEDRRASRIHARIEWRRDKFTLIDTSTNGSYVIVEDESEIQLRREEIRLQKSGSISLGHPYKKDPTETIKFFVQTN
ncbi:MAG: adenylate/guanylate cyclase domain-containing protein [Gallionella sp.]